MPPPGWLPSPVAVDARGDHLLRLTQPREGPGQQWLVRPDAAPCAFAAQPLRDGAPCRANGEVDSELLGPVNVPLFAPVLAGISLWRFMSTIKMRLKPSGNAPELVCEVGLGDLLWLFVQLMPSREGLLLSTPGKGGPVQPDLRRSYWGQQGSRMGLDSVQGRT